EREFDETATKSLSKGALEIQLILERAAEESERKSDRVGAAWKTKRQRAEATGAVMTGRCPAWLKPTADGTGFAVIRDRAEVVRRVYQLAADGYGIRAIVGELTEVTAEDVERDERTKQGRRAERRKKGTKARPTVAAEPGTLSKMRVKLGVKPFGRTADWTRAYISKLLSDRRVLGELRPTVKGKPVGEPLTKYYPAILTEGEWLTARAGMGQRRNRPGRVSAERVNVFAGLLREARAGDAYQMTGRVSANPGRPPRAFQVLVNANSTNGRGKGYSVPYDPFEAAVLSALREISPTEVLPPADVGGKNERSALEKELAGVEAELAKVAGWLETKGFSPTLATHLEKLEIRKADLTAKL
ncbi:MAG: recombinase family protein, partial [Acidimicrobiales bacterium]|nr:recombinase family protein [Acidimicrobiales bacterium]